VRNEGATNLPKPGIDQLLIESALQPELRRRLLESPDEVFRDFDLSEEEKEILRRPDHRLLPLLGAALARQMESSVPLGEAPSVSPAPPALIEARTLPDTWLALTVVPCAQFEEGHRISYVVWANPIPEGGDPAALPPPAGVVLPGQPLAPLYVVIQLSAVQTQDAAGNPQVGLWASLRHSSNVAAPPPPETAGDPKASPFGSRLDSPQVQAAVAAVRGASREERYNRLIDLMRVLRSGDVR
jgi:hypothetical protein